jgi:hypothetical protein
MKPAPSPPKKTQVVTNSNTDCRMVSYTKTVQNSSPIWSPNQQRGKFHVLTKKPVLLCINVFLLAGQKYWVGNQRFLHKLAVVTLSPRGIGVQKVPILKLSLSNVISNLEPT